MPNDLNECQGVSDREEVGPSYVISRPYRAFLGQTCTFSFVPLLKIGG